MAAFACARFATAAGASTGRKRSSAVLPTSAIGLVAVLHAGQVDDDVAPLARDLRLGDAEGVDPVADDVDGHVEGVGLELADRREHDRHAALEVEAEHRLVTALQRDRGTCRPRARAVTTRNQTLRRTVTRRPAPFVGASSVGGDRRPATSIADCAIALRRRRVSTTPRRDLELDLLVVELADRAEDPADGDDLVTDLRARRAAPGGRGAAPLRADDQEEERQREDGEVDEDDDASDGILT